ncbi:MAG: gamma carbonic anhydrase family protein, partial [Ignavibacteriaceae bacterium]
TVNDYVLIGMGAIIMDDAVIGSRSIIAAGAVVLQGTIVPSNSIYAGVPAKFVKNVEGELKEVFQRTANNYIMYKNWFH